MIGFSVPGADLAAATAFLAGLAPSRPSEPVFGGVRIDADAETGTATLAVYDAMTAIGGTATMSAEASSGQVLVSARLLAAIAATLTGEAAVDLSLPDGASTVVVAAGRSRWELPMLELRDYPELPGLGPAVGEVEVAEFAAALGRVVGFTGELPTQMAGGVCLCTEGVAGESALTLAATDQWRLGVAEIPYAGSAITDLLAPVEVLTTAATALRKETASRVTLHLGGAGQQRFAVAGERFAVQGPRLAGSNPGIWRNIEKIMGEPVTRVVVDAGLLTQTVRRAAAVIDPKDALVLSVSTDLSTEETEFTVGAQAGTRSITEHTCEVITHDGPPVRVGVSAQYLTQGLVGLGSSAVALEFAARATKPFRLIPVDEHGAVISGYRHLVAPQYVPAAGGVVQVAA